MFRSFLVILFVSVFLFRGNAQCNVVVSSSNGYNVNITVKVVKVIPSTTNCPYGYNYNLAIEYTVAYSGSNQPGSLYTLQGNISCGSQSLFYDLPNGPGVGTYTTGSNPYIGSDGNNIYTTKPSCTAANPTNLNCNTITVDINGPGINNQTVNCPYSATSPLPIGLTHFTGSNTKNGVLLNWETSTEKNNKNFNVEKSNNGVDWISIAELPGAGTSAVKNTYSHLDDVVNEGIVYYRLKQTDFDHNYSYSSVIYIMNAVGNLYCSQVWPNPSNNEFNFEISAPNDGRASYTLFNDVGAAVKKGDIDFYTGKNEVKLTTENVSQGYYVLEISFGENSKLYRKLIKL